MRSTIAVDVAAPPDLVFALARDVSRWERLLPHYARSRVVREAPGGRICSFVARREVVPLVGLGLPVAWRSRTWSEPGLRRLRFVHLGGATAGMDVAWRIEPTGAGTRIEIEHEFAAALPGVALLLDRAFVRPIAARTLATFKALAEAIVESDAAAGTNPGT